MLKRFLRGHGLIVGFLAVLLPLAILLGMQYRWLTSLAKTSAIAEKAWLSNYLEAVSTEVEYYYRTQAERALNLPPDLFALKSGEKILYHLKKKTPEGARFLFAVRYIDRNDWGKLYAYDPIEKTFGPPSDQGLYRAISVALAPWRTLATKAATLQSHEPTVDEMDPDNLIILKPISNDSCQIVGVAGMVVNIDHFRDSVLPAAIEKSLPKFFDCRAQENLVMTVRDGRGRLVMGEPGGDATAGEVTASMPFIFTDWELALGSRYATPEQWAESNFLLNISMSALLAVVLLGGIVFALRTASREVHLSDMKSDFVSNVSHELRTPLASIRVFGEFLRLGRVREDEKILEYGEYIETESSRLTQLINNILDFSKIESGAKTYRFEPADLREVVSDTLRTFEVSLKHRGFRLNFEQPSKPVPLIEVDTDAISQAVSNLVDNAVKYSNGANEITVSLEPRGEKVAITVKDHGIGISQDEQKKIFERFHRAGSSLVHDVKGSGLGLSIVRHIVEAHRGEVRVDSAPGHGSSFSIHLPVDRRKPRAERTQGGTAVEPAGQGNA